MLMKMLRVVDVLPISYVPTPLVGPLKSLGMKDVQKRNVN